LYKKSISDFAPATSKYRPANMSGGKLRENKVAETVGEPDVTKGKKYTLHTSIEKCQQRKRFTIWIFSNVPCLKDA